MPIRELSPDVVTQIAAGEVITRAGDVVKELVENAVDAILTRVATRAGSSDGASEPSMPLTGIGTISVEIVDGGHTHLQVADDGCGIPPNDLAAAVRRHATSKITSADDLERLGSLGFRGEALAAIGAVADVSLVAATQDGSLGASIAVIDGSPGPVVPLARRPGTTVSVDRLFERVPARRKYQRASSTETAHVGGLLQAYALAYPEIAFALICDGRSVLRTSGSGDLREAAMSLFGPEAAQELLMLRDHRDPGDESVAWVGLSGLIGSPSLHRATRGGIFLTVNRRPVESRSLVYAVEEAYATQIPVGRHPVAMLDLAAPPDAVDANVHPTKREVRLQRERLAFSALQQSVRATLVQTIGIPAYGEPRGRPAPVPESPFASSDVPMLSYDRPADSWGEGDRPRLGTLRILGQVSLTYIICEGRAGLYLVDQHAAHERVVLEQLERDAGRPGQSQLLLESVVVTLPRAVRGAIDEYVAALRDLGFNAESFGEEEVVVRSVPAALRPRHIDGVLQETHEALDGEGAGPDWRERLAILLSCKTAVKAGQRLEVAEMQALLEQLDEANLCNTCSHGRPTAILLSHSRLEREFGRR